MRWTIYTRIEDNSVSLGLKVFCKKLFTWQKKFILHDVEKLTQETSKMISDVTCDSWNRHNRYEQTYGLSYPMKKTIIDILIIINLNY